MNKTTQRGVPLREMKILQCKLYNWFEILKCTVMEKWELWILPHFRYIGQFWWKQYATFSWHTWPTIPKKTTFLTVQNDIFVAMESQDCTAFDMMNHQILLDIWSIPIKLMVGVAHGSVLRQLLFNMFTTSLSWDLSKANECNDIKHQLYTDDTQVHNSFNTCSFKNSIPHLSQSKTEYIQTSWSWILITNSYT